MKTKTIHIIPHSHWDKEWYFTSSRSKIYLMRHVQEVMQTLTDNPDFTHYLLDGQTSLITDYLKYYPEDKHKIKQLISDKRLIIGPWTTQTDQLVVCAESIVRNLYYGISDAQDLGYSMKIAYCPDVFGQAANMPQIYTQFELNGFLFWRGISDDRLKQSEFIWQGVDGSRILAHQLFFAYYYGLNIPKNRAILPDYINSVIVPLEKRTESGHIYFPNGGDQAPIQQNLPEVIALMNELDSGRKYKISNPDDFFSYLKDESFTLPVIKGEMIEGKNSRIHKSIYSTRADLKQANNRIENKITNLLEPILTISHVQDHLYPTKELEEIWKMMFENAAHDSIGGCNSDATNQDIKARYKLIEEMVDNLLDLHLREIAMSINQNERYAITVFNTLPYQRTTLLETDLYLPDGEFKIVDKNGNELNYHISSQIDHSDYLLNQFTYLTPHLYKQEMEETYIPNKAYLSHLKIEVKEVPALGYTQIYLIPDAQSNLNKALHFNEESEIENSFYTVSFDDKTSSFTVVDKTSNHVYAEQFVLIENGDDGDSYNYSPPRTDLIISSKESMQNRVIEIEKNDLYQKISCTFELKVPSCLENRAKGLCDAVLSLKQTVELRKDEKLVRVLVECNNTVSSHRLCVCCATAIYADYAIVDRLFGVEKVPFTHPNINNWQQEKWTEAPIAINPMQSFVALSDEHRTVALMTQGVREYEVIGSQFETIQLTLFRSFSWMGKENLIYRPNRASGEKILATPDAELKGLMTFEFAALYENDCFDNADIAKTAKEYLSPLQQYPLADFLNGRTIFKKNPLAKTQPTEFSLIDFKHCPVILSALKKAEKSDHLIYRIFNPFLTKKIPIDSLLNQKDEAVSLNESTRMERISILKPNQFQTFKR
ncbi:glycoside hydrolase family 38 C-terminal domain-containing protein [Orbus sturtevantii]|uniref:glycoside hydrolase family 38 N-terminal domain-containing protein n=1 Tax=Orbus sturtevantii TaxID=3074109 RepID=UPI00370D8035